MEFHPTSFLLVGVFWYLTGYYLNGRMDSIFPQLFKLAGIFLVLFYTSLAYQESKTG